MLITSFRYWCRGIPSAELRSTAAALRFSRASGLESTVMSSSRIITTLDMAAIIADLRSIISTVICAPEPSISPDGLPAPQAYAPPTGAAAGSRSARRPLRYGLLPTRRRHAAASGTDCEAAFRLSPARVRRPCWEHSHRSDANSLPDH